MTQNRKLSTKEQGLSTGRQLVVWQRKFINILTDGNRNVQSIEDAKRYGYMAWYRQQNGNLTPFSAADQTAFFQALQQVD